MTISHVALLGIVLVSFAVIGCGGSSRPANALPTKPVKVTVTYKGAPVADATVCFVPDGEGPPAFGKSDAQGTAKMKTYLEDDGAVLGGHKVSIIKSEGSSTGGTVADVSSPEYVPPAGGGTPVPVVKYLIPQKYSAPATSGLIAEVKDSGPNEFTFELKD